jgi:hypothetical protein
MLPDGCFFPGAATAFCGSTRVAVNCSARRGTPLPAVDLPVDVVDVFRPSDEAEAVAAGAIGIGARVLWFQPGTDTPQAAHLAREAGLTVVTGLCMGATHGQLGLGPGPTATRPA